MKYLAPYAFLLCVSVVSAEMESTNLSATNTPSKNTEQMRVVTEGVAQRLLNILGLAIASKSNQVSISLKGAVIKALNEGRPMSEIRQAMHQAVKEATGKVLPSLLIADPIPIAVSEDSQVAATQARVIVANPAEVSFDQVTGKMMATVLSGESIFRLAQRVYGKENGRMYLEIHAANRDRIKNINVVAVGQTLIMP